MNKNVYLIQKARNIFTGKLKTVFFAFFLLFINNTIGQNLPSIKSSVDKTRILIGEPLQLIIQTEASSPIFPEIDTIPHFEFLEKRVDTVENGNTITIKGVYTITSFDSGRWNIPSIRLTANVKSDTIPVDVVFSDFDPAQDYHSIKDIIETEIRDSRFPWWWYAAGAVLIVAAIYVYFKRKKPIQKFVAVKPTTSPFEEAMHKLEKLSKENLSSKEYYSTLVDIFRGFVFRTKGIRSMQKTTDDLVIQLASLRLGTEKHNELAQVLRLSDFVKFAKFKPEREDDRYAFETVKNIIIEMNKAETRPPLEKETAI